MKIPIAIEHFQGIIVCYKELSITACSDTKRGIPSLILWYLFVKWPSNTVMRHALFFLELSNSFVTKWIHFLFTSIDTSQHHNLSTDYLHNIVDHAIYVRDVGNDFLAILLAKPSQDTFFESNIKTLLGSRETVKLFKTLFTRS